MDAASKKNEGVKAAEIALVVMVWVLCLRAKKGFVRTG